MFCQIEHCWRYAKGFDRTLIVDTEQSFLAGAFCDFFTPLDSSEKAVFNLTEELLRLLNGSRCFPASIVGRLSDYVSVLTDANTYVEADSGERLSFDFNKEYDETVLVHEQCGGGKESCDLLSRLRFSDELTGTIGEKLKDLPSRYAAVHVRHTDYETDYHSFFRKIGKRVAEQPLLICSDDASVIRNGAAFFDRSRIVTVTHVPETEGKPLHIAGTHESTGALKEAAINSFVDLVALGKADRFFFTVVKNGFPSGFSQLAAYLCDHKEVIASLMGEETDMSVTSGRSGSVRIQPLKIKIVKALPRPVRNLF